MHLGVSENAVRFVREVGVMDQQQFELLRETIREAVLPLVVELGLIREQLELLHDAQCRVADKYVGPRQG